jgi:subtilase family serine protease
VIYNGTGSASWLYGLEPGTTYHFAVFEYNGTGSEIFYLTNPYLSGTGSTLSNPTVQSGNAFISSRSNSSINISWTKGDGANRLLIGRKDGPVNVEPQDLTNYSVSSTFGTREIGTGNFLLYGGTGTNINITNLEAGTNYHFALFEYNGSNAKLYLRPGYQFALETFGERPTLQVSNATYSNVDFTSFNVAFTPGNGSRRLVLARAGSPVNAGPSDFFSYAANHMFGHGDQIGNGNYVVYNDFGDNFQLSGLTPGVTYYFAYFEYSMSQQGELYLSPAYTSTQATKQPFDLNLTAITSPASACELTAGESITIEVTNESTTPVTSFIAGYSINGSTPVNEVVSGENLLPGNGSVTYTFQTLADLSVDGDYTIEAFIILEGDVNENNNVRTATVRNFPEPVTTITDDSSISQGQAITLVATGGVSYEWSNGETTSDITVQPLVTTQYTVTITDANGCSVVRVVTVEVIPDPCYGVNCPPGTICYDGSCFAYTVQVGGVVTDADISIPLEGVKVSNGASEVYSDINGAWSLDAIALTTILVSLDGYHSQELDVQAEDHILNVQLVSLCSGVECPPGYKCISGGCFQIDPCSDVECPSGYECLDGECYPIDPCSLVTCPDGMECHQGGCFFNYVSVSGSVVHSGLGMPLSGVAVKLEQTGVTLGTTDAQGYFDVEITAGNRLVFEMSGYEPFVSEVVLEGQTGWLIELVDILCVDLTCPPGTVCYGGACIPIDPCSDVECPSGYECLDGECYPIDPCSLVTCPDGTECYQGQCIPVAFEVTGIVRDLETNELLSGVSVESTSQYFYTGDILTDENGYYSIFVEYNGVVNFTKAGYEIFSSSPVVETPTVLDVFLQPLENPCENVTCPPGEVCVGGQCFPVLCEASFTSLQITPEIGTSETEFTFTISYADPAESSLDIGFPMLQLIAENSSAENPIPDLFVTMSEVDPTDEILADGKLYQAVVSGLSDNTSWKASVRAVNENGCETLSAEVNAPQVSVSNLDVAIYANNISFSNETPSINEAITIFARIRNISDFPAENFVVSAYDNDLQIYSTTIQFLSPRSHIDVSWEYSFVDAGFYPIKVVIDETDVLEEINELNNFAIRPVLAGNYVLPGGIDVTAMPNTQTVYVNSWITVSGNAYYYGIDDGVNPNVAGANATMNYENGSFETTSGSGGNFSRSIRMPAVPGVYTFNVSITDYTLTGHAEPFEVTVIPYPDKPDLVASILLGQSSVLTGETITGVATVSNSGDATASNFIFRISSCEGILDEILIASLAPGESLQFSFETSVSATGSCFNKNNCTFYATADVGNAVDEKTKTNNTSSRSMTVYPPLPDLTPSRSLVSSSSAMEQPFLFTVKVDNIGGVPAGTPFTVNVYVDDVLTDSRDFSDLGSCAQVSYEVEVLFATQEDHVIRIKVDEPLGSGAVHEYSENNNEFVRTVKYLSPNLRPNLNVRIQDLSVNPVLPLPNESFEINATVRNNGSASISGPVDVRFTVSTDGVETIYDTTLPDGLAFGSSAQLTVSTVLPSYGGHSVLVELDPGNLIAESSEYDNKAEMPLCVDFAPSQSGSVWGGGFFVNTSQNLTGRVRNLGLFTATNVGVTFLLDDVEIGSAVIPELGPTYAGLGHYVSIPYTFRDVGTFELTMVVDRSDDYIECNESNNETSRMITVRGPQPDLRILSEYISPTELNPDLNEEINLFVSFENIGAAPAQAFKVRVTVDDQQLGDDIQVSGLGAGQLTTVPVGVPYSSQTAGIKVIRGFVDVLQEADDVNYNNNEASRAIVVGQAPNLLFAGISLSASCPQTGDVVEISVDVENEGDMAADAEVHFYYISETDTIPIDFVPIYVDLQSTVSTSINWTVVNPDYSIYAEIKKSVPVEFNNLDNSIRAEFEDTTPPTVIVKNITVYLDENGVVEMAPEDVDDGSFDECGIAEMILDFHTFDCVAAGHYALVTLTVTDFSGNSASAEVEVLVLDTLPPVISGIPEDIAVDNDEGLCSAVVTWEEPSAGDNCEVESFTSDWNSGDAFPVGTTTVTYTATDIHGNVQTASFDVVVTDSELPVITGIPENIVVSMDLESDGAVVTWDEPAATDNCGGYSLEQSAGLASGSIFPVGITVVEYTATDASGNTTTASFTVTVIDTRAPQIVGLPELIEVNNDPDACGAIVAWTEPTTSHIYEVISLEQTDGPESGSFFPVGVTSVTYKAEDIHGNIATVSFTVTVIDNQPPVVITRDIQRVINEGESVVIQPSDLDSGSYDHCGIASMSLSRTTFTDADEGENLVILTVTDISGNIASGNAKVTITVNRETCTIQARAKDMTVYLSKDGVASINARQADDGSSTTCKGKLDLLLSQSLFTCLDLGIREVFLIARDRNGNEATASFMVMVLDNLAPAIAKTPNKLSITLAENEVFVLPDYRGVYPANDNCSVEGYIQFPEPGTVYTQPTVIQLTLTASDGSGNQTSAGIEITLARAGQTKGPVPKSAEISFESNSVEQDVRMWPNPSTGLVYISVPMEEGTDVRIEVHNVDGRKVHTANFTAGHPLLLDMTGQVAGLYMVRIFSGDQVFVRKLIRTDTH